MYATAVSQPQEGETAVYRAPDAKDQLVYTPALNIKTVQDIHVQNFGQVPHKKFIGRRPTVEGKMLEKYEWLTYGQVEKRAKAIGSGMINLNLAPTRSEFKGYNLNFIAIYGKNSTDWLVTDIACTLYNITSVPVYDTLGEEATQHMFNETNLTTCFLTTPHIKVLVNGYKNKKVGQLETLVILDEENITEEHRTLLADIKHYTLSQVEQEGNNNLQELKPTQPDDIYTFSYTSGTTGTPKGAMISHRNIIAGIGAACKRIGIKNFRYLSYLPMAHVYERFCINFITYKQGEIGMYNGDPLKLKDDLAILQPSLFASVPRLYNKFYDVMKAGLGKLTGMKKTLANRAIQVKLANLRSSASYTHTIYDKLVFNKMKSALGGKVEFMTTASAPISVEILEFLKIAFQAPICEAYGQTEGLGAEFITLANDPASGHCGGPLPHNEFKLVDVPEMKYFSTDKDEKGQPCPRGEICVRGANVIPGYYKNDEKTKETIDEDGWLHSGDIGKVLPGTRALMIVDRLKNIFKLSQGEYIAPDKLEQVYKSAAVVGDIFVYGDSLKSVLVAIVQVEQREVEKMAKQVNVNGTFEEMIENEEIKKLVLADLNVCATNAKLKGFERIKKVHLHPKQFADDDLVTTTFKLKRNEAKAFFLGIIEKLYVGQN